MSVQQPKWTKPTQTQAPKLKILNSLTKKKEEFVPKNGNQVSWYICGPTVYDKTHLGHARTYTSFDIIRRILEDFFNYDLVCVMNITDIDDKIIVTARQKHLFSNFMRENPVINPQVLDICQKAFEHFITTRFSRHSLQSPAAWPEFLKKANENQIPTAAEDEKFSLYLKTAKQCQAAQSQSQSAAAADFYEQVKDVLALYLDSLHGQNVTDASIYREFTEFWEQDYFKDMDALNIKRPDILTRVTEYVPEIVEYCEKIIANGYAYEHEGSVYFDTRKYDSSSHDYAKLAPWSASDVKLLQEGEGSLIQGTKRHPSDFALWKASKPGEPFWDSPWGKGRPGWHIECSVMASAILGSNMDIHGGGIDLQFPHHDNELAQSEAHYDCPQWVNYFLHTGHLHIEGLKMSKSLKNFLTIEDTLKNCSPSVLRLFFLMQRWEAMVDYSAGSISEAKMVEASIKNFLGLVQAVESEPQPKQHNFAAKEHEILEKIQTCQEKVREALCDSFDTPSAITAMRNLISQCNIYYNDKQKAKEFANVSVLRKAATYIEKMLNIFGVQQKQLAQNDGELMPALRTMSKFRDEVRQLAMGNEATPSTILELCDKLRDIDLVPHGVSLEDRENGPALVKLVDPDFLLAQRQEKLAKLQATQQKKAEAKAKELEAELLRKQKASIHPRDMFKTSEYKEWDSDGIPTVMSDGEPVSKSKKKKIIKEYEAQMKLWSKYNQ